MMKKYPLLLSILLINLVMNGQVTKVDSLLRQLSSAKEDTNTVKLYLQIGQEYEGIEPLKAKEYYKKGRELSTQLNYYDGKIKSVINYASVFSVTGEYDSLKFYGEQVLGLARAQKDSLNIGIALLNIGMAYGYLEDYESAIQYCQEGLKIVEGKAHIKIEAQINDKLQVLYWQMAQYDKAIGFGEKAVKQARELDMQFELAQSLSNLSLSYNAINNLQKVQSLLAEALEIAKAMGNINLESSILLNLSDNLLVSGDYDKAKQYIDKSLLLNRTLGSQPGEAISLRALATYYLLTKDFSKAKEAATASAILAAKNSLTLEHAEGIHILSYAAIATGDMKRGYLYFREYGDSIRSLVKKVLSQKSAELEKKYETEKKEGQIKKLQAEKQVQEFSIRQKNTLNYILVGSAVALIIISLLLYKNYRNKQNLQQQRINELEREKQLAATEAVLKGEEQERTRLAKDLHDGLGGMLSGIKYSFQTMKGNLIMTPENALAFERSMDMLDSSIKEMRRVAHNMMPEALIKFGLDTALKDFCNDINQTGALKVIYQSIGLENAELDRITAITVYRIVQELINNTMKHAAAKTAIVQVSKSAGRLSVTVEDDGKGFDVSILQSHGGMGWDNIRNRVEFLKGTLDVSSRPDTGTSVLIELNTEA